MNTKTCFKCHKTKPIDEFYKQSGMADGHLGKCKDCTRSDVKINRIDNRDKYILYEKERKTRPERKEQQRKYFKAEKQKHPEKRYARVVVGNAVRDGRLQKQPCKVCGNPNVQAHHRDYSKPLEVEWLCVKHHKELHKQEAGSSF